MKKKSTRYVMVDRGYMTNECWYHAKVINSRPCVKNLFTGEMGERLLVELPGGERIWVDYWTEVTKGTP